MGTLQTVAASVVGTIWTLGTAWGWFVVRRYPRPFAARAVLALLWPLVLLARWLSYSRDVQ